VPQVDLGPDHLGVQLGEPDGEAGRDERDDDRAGLRRVLLEDDDQRQADDRAIDDTRDLARSEMGCERPAQR